MKARWSARRGRPAPRVRCERKAKTLGRPHPARRNAVRLTVLLPVGKRPSDQDMTGNAIRAAETRVVIETRCQLGKILPASAARPIAHMNAIARKNPTARQNKAACPANPRPAIRSWSHDRDRDRDYRTSDRWNRDWRRDTRYDWRSHRNRYHQNYRVERYRSPSFGYRYAPLSIGFRLSRPFYAQSYWIDDPWRYRLPDVYGPYQWVRYYDDVLLVDTFNGEVVDVIRDFFW